ncbi:PAS domain-containing hybrid sensor histidine kinase/response regulator [Pararhizobium antarcticum]|uniref:histidine kinase n=1 Tax=Pararhizobium antarcticum TaxID=1798805 RepID=A0A657LKK1_9HYPH|nr:ATP-binding protein [Pararhizobium antarcticum]OJF90516.1 hybrid sensor histidine kinase/response regulator [Pararhizobium antarcticum]OJF98592.1 hybrid sensor histidine kinase/response regulator [Rhizobium sp. 58]
MSELSKLQQRINAEFSAPEQVRTLGRRGTDADYHDDLHSLEPEDDSVLREERYPALRPALAGAGLLCSAAVFGTGMDAGLYFLSGCLAVGGVTGAALLLRDWHRASSRKPGAARQAAVEKVGDRQWERNETSQLLSTIHDALGDIAIVREPGGKIVQANTVFRQLTGCAKPEGMTCEGIGLNFEPEPAPRHFRVRIPTGDGLRIFDWHDVIAREPASGQFMLHSIARDITEESRIARESEEARRRAESASQAKSRLLATVSHEIRTPLSGILGMSHLISQTRLTGEQKNYLAGMRQSGHALVQLVDDLLDFSSIEAGRFQLRPSREPLRELIESVVEMLSHRAHEKGIEIGATISADVPGLLDFDAARLRQVLFNVIGNAVKFTHTGGVFVDAGIQGQNVVIRIDDTGPGMSMDEQARVFDEFEQAGAAKQRSAGTGLGLAISRRIIEAFGGKLVLSSKPGEGSRFEIGFPAVGGDLSAAPRIRRGILAESRVLVMAPAGPASKAIEATITTLGGLCCCVTSVEEAQAFAVRAISGAAPLTDIIVDHRHAAHFLRLLSALPQLEDMQLRKTYLVNPEERSGRPINQMDGYDAWLIRPLREKSLVEVLKGRMKGMEVRDAINDNRPMLRDVPAHLEPAAASGILLAEDDPINAFLVRSVLEKAGHTVRVVGDFGALGAALYDAPVANLVKPELIVTDLNMPGGDAFAMIRRIRDQERQSGGKPVPIIVVTSDTRPDICRQLLDTGADSVLPKPADPKTLTAVVEELLER